MKEKGGGKKIRGISVNLAWNSGDEKIDNQIILNKINQINNGFFKDDILQKIEVECETEWSEEEFFYYTQGHDFFMLFAAICDQYRTKGIKYTEMEASSRCSFKDSDFVNTNLFNRLNTYENLQHMKICNVIMAT